MKHSELSESIIQTPDQVKRNHKHGSLIQLRNAIEQLPDQGTLDMYHPLLHEIVAALTTILNYGIDLTKLNAVINMDESRGFYYALSLLIYSRKSFKFINTLKFLKNEKMRSSLWLLLELSAGTIGEVIWNNQELLYKYTSYSIIKCNMGEIIDLLDLFILKKITVTGEIIDRFHQFIDFTIELPALTEPDNSSLSKNALAPIHRKQFGDMDTPSGFGNSPQLTITLQNDSVLQSQDNESMHNITFQLKTTKQKNSHVLLNSLYEKYVENFQYKLLLQEPKSHTLKDQLNKCHGCQIDIHHRSILWFRRATVYYCHFTGFYYCISCMSEINSIIPRRVVKRFDFKTYPINKASYEELETNYYKPIIMLNYYEDVVYQHKELYEFLIIKRSLQLLYDIFCTPQIINQLLAKRTNLVLPINLFSLHDLMQVKDGTLIIQLRDIYSRCVQHIAECTTCMRFGISCRVCRNPTLIFAYDIENTQYCLKCKQLYHRKCFPKYCGCEINI